VFIGWVKERDFSVKNPVDWTASYPNKKLI
jgi:hypothetical protein